jgi:hypothetical protein
LQLAAPAANSYILPAAKSGFEIHGASAEQVIKISSNQTATCK